MDNPRIDELIRTLGLLPLEKEGGYFHFISQFGDGAGTIYYLVTEESFSHLHQLSEDEAWYFLEGDPVRQILLGADGKVSSCVLDEDNRVRIVPKGVFQATFIPEPRKGYALFTTVMSPHYREDMYVHGKDVEWVSTIEEVKDVL